MTATKTMGVTHELRLGSDRSFSCIKGKKISVSYKFRQNLPYTVRFPKPAKK
jgi:hypothetical protein